MKRDQTLPDWFKPLAWSWDFDKINPHKDTELIIRQTVNYGTLKHWHWIKSFYGEAKIREVIAHTPATAFRPQALRLASLIFKVTQFSHALRGTHR